ncbi:DNA-binding XRE family transcriptional regulator [Streptomyces sp. PanSC19]|uniref:helix-turn-helix domain-containing protein n=1 Tax=Streptomyces sp. PanSC19 TaxID=1520455 RepID=UPI000F4846AC|nr:helix-turn-helix domain-containing protein [Streptomyces sp. PanSC19]ROQ23572.1 DNA-binding XRE family transcriptional regulator [Streptomyces sp. PanSC19]
MIDRAQASGEGEAEQRALLGRRLKDTREYLGLSQQQVAERTGIVRSAVSDIERGMRRVEVMELQKLARLYRLSVSYFLDEDEAADAGEHAFAGLPRTKQPLSEGDRIEVAKFIQYLQAKREAEQQDGQAPRQRPGRAR